jgi:hypothetical protein
MKYSVVLHNTGSLAAIRFEEEKMNSTNLFFSALSSQEKYEEVVSKIKDVLSGKIEKKLLTSYECEVLLQKETTEIEFKPDVVDESEMDMTDKFTYIPTERFLEAVEIWWREYSQHADR